MVTVNGSTDIRQVLVGWKEIAGALGVSQSTARRWRREAGLPTYRICGQVRARGEDLEKWEEAYHKAARKQR